MTRARACRQTRFRLLWVHCHLGLPCHRAPLLCRTIAVPLLVQPRPDTLLSTYSPSPHVDHDHDHHHLTTTKPPPLSRLSAPPRSPRRRAQSELHTPHVCLHAHRSAARRGRGGPKVDGTSKHGWTREEDEAVVAMVLTSGQKWSTLSKGWRYGGASAHYSGLLGLVLCDPSNPNHAVTMVLTSEPPCCNIDGATPHHPGLLGLARLPGHLTALPTREEPLSFSGPNGRLR